MKRLTKFASVAGAVVCLGVTLPADVAKYSHWLDVMNLGDVVNSPGPVPAGEDSTPFVSRDGLSLYFMSNRPGGWGETDLWVSTRASRTADWGLPQNLGPVVNGPDREHSPRLSPDGHRLYFAVVRNGNFDLYVSRRRDKRDNVGWEPPTSVAELNTPYHDVGLAFFEDEVTGDLVGYFVSGRPTGPDDMKYDTNVYVTRLQEDGTFTPPALVPELSTDEYYEWGPTVRRDGLEVFFDASWPTENQPGAIFTATRENQGDPWSTPTPVPYPVNGDGRNLGPWLSFDGTELYFASSRRNAPSWPLPFLDLNVATRDKLKRK